VSTPTKPTKRATLKDIAAELGLSPSTVSRALAGHSHVNQSTRSAILRAADRLGYQPNAIARALRRQSTRTIGLVVPSIVNDFFALCADAIQLAAERSGYQVMLCLTSDDPAREAEYLETLAAHNVAGIILTSCRTAGADNLEADIPVVEIARRSESKRSDFVGAADRDGTEEITRHLVALGHRRIGIVTGSTSFSPGRDRITGYKGGLASAEIPIAKELIMPGNPSKEWAREATAKLLELPDRPTAIVATGTQLLLGTFEALQEAGLSCPEDVSVAGFEDPPWFAIWRPGITTYASPMREMGFLAWQLLLSRMTVGTTDNPGVTVSRLSGVLEVRGSTRSLAVRDRA
jgi:LacI family transcriptional regulator